MKRLLTLLLIWICHVSLAQSPAQCAAGIFENQTANEQSLQSETDDALRLRDIDPASVAKLKNSYKICVDFPDQKFCTIPGVSLWQRHQNSQLLLQINEIAKFIAAFHVDLSGRKQALFGFREVHLAPTSDMKRFAKLQLVGDRLVIGVPNYWVVGYRPYSALQIRALWDRGKMFPPFSAMRSRWRYLNPVGEFRVGLRSALHSAAQIARKKIGQLTQQLDEQPQAVAESAERLVDVQNLEKRLVEKLRAADPSHLRRVLTRWEKELEDPGLAESLVDSGLVSGIFDSSPRNYYVRMYGALNVGNIHDIGVKIRLGLLKYIKIDRDAPVIDVDVRGLINVYTIDNVQVSIDFTRSIETAALENSLQIP